VDRRRRGGLLVVVVASYRQTCLAYPNGGGAYAVSRANLGPNAALVAASALLLDYVLTVADSVAAGVANIVSAFPDLAPHAVAMSRGFVGLLSVMNLRGTRESGTVFAIPKAETQIVHMRDGSTSSASGSSRRRAKLCLATACLK
jgi:amino acid transporter